MLQNLTKLVAAGVAGIFVVGSAFALVINVIVATPWDAGKGLGMVLLGCPIYWLLIRNRLQRIEPTVVEPASIQTGL